MILETYTPSAPLNKYVELLAYYKGYNPDYSFERILPEGNVEILIALDEIERYFYDGVHLKETFTCKKVWVAGMQQGYLHANADKDSSLFAIKFKAGGSYPFLHLPLVELNNLFVDAELILGPNVLLLREQLLHVTRPDEMFALVEKFLLNRFESTSHHQAVANLAASKITTMTQTSSLKLIAAELGYSHKQFIHLFKKYIGLSPKQYQKIVRFNQALKQVYRHNSDCLQIDYGNGYYDQAHFINEFKGFTGFSPGNYLTHRGEFLNFIPLYGER